MFDNQEMTPELILWGKVVEMAFSDAFVDEDFWKKTHHQERNVFKYNYDQAHAWFSLGNKDFILTCQYAGLDPEFVMRLYHKRKAGNKRLPLDIRTIRKSAQAATCVIMLTLGACAQAPAPVERQFTIPNVKACIAEYDAEGFIGTREQYVDGCYRFAPVRF